MRNSRSQSAARWLNRQQLYQSFKALGNLTEKAGTIRMTVEAQAGEGFEQVWLRNAVLEPLEEADIEVESEPSSSLGRVQPVAI